ncbi:MAG: hypothetical protein WKG07_42790 [Hymenobacter sp.]
MYPHATLGNIFILANATVFGLYLVLVQPLMRKYHAFTVLARVFLVGAIVASAVRLARGVAHRLRQLPAENMAE